MRLLALDQASKTSGYAIFEDNKLITHGHFTFEDAILGQRLLKIRQKVDSLIAEYNINFVVFEDIQLQSNVGNNVSTYKALAEVIGVISELLEEKDMKYECLLASQWKSILGIKGKTRPEQKRNSQEYVLNNCRVKATQDEADSINIGLAFLKSWAK